MAAKAKPEPPHAVPGSLPGIPMLAELVQPGNGKLLRHSADPAGSGDAAKRQYHRCLRERLAAARSVPVAALTELAGEGISNFIAAQRVLAPGAAAKRNPHDRL